MPKFDFGSFLTGIAVILLILIIIVFAMIKFRDQLREKADSEPLYQQPTWTDKTE